MEYRQSPWSMGWLFQIPLVQYMAYDKSWSTLPRVNFNLLFSGHKTNPLTIEQQITLEFKIWNYVTIHCCASVVYMEHRQRILLVEVHTLSVLISSISFVHFILRFFAPSLTVIVSISVTGNKFSSILFFHFQMDYSSVCLMHWSCCSLILQKCWKFLDCVWFSWKKQLTRPEVNLSSEV